MAKLTPEERKQREYMRELDRLIKFQRRQRKQYEQSDGATRLRLLQIENEEKLKLALRYFPQERGQ